MTNKKTNLTINNFKKARRKAEVNLTIKSQAFSQIVILIIAVFAFSFIVAIPDENIVEAQLSNVCCEKTIEGAFCQNTQSLFCNPDYRKTPTSCDATSFCKAGTCYDSDEGICMENTPQIVCQEAGGVWDVKEANQLSQCKLGCCVLGDQASFVTLVRCKKLASFYGLEADYRPNVQSETECIEIANSQDKGACVYEKEFQKTCKFTTRGECKTLTSEGNTTGAGETTFYKDYLCSAEELATNCAKQTKTSCVDGKDEVYWIDSCGNPENIYSADKEASWNNGRVLKKENSCNAGNNNANSPDCGNCDYFLGSYCKKYEKGKDPAEANPTYGDYFCRDLNCKKTSNGQDFRHGETWCVYDGSTGAGADAVGSRHFKHLCVTGEELVEPCADFRQEMCIQGQFSTEAGNFNEAACRANRWQECTNIRQQSQCLNKDKYDCKWVGNVEGLPEGLCVPNVPPGLKFWEEGEASGICGFVNAECTVIFEEDIFGKEKCIKNCECLEDSWGETLNSVCTSIGDCGGYVNYIGKYTDSGYSWKIDGEDKKLSTTEVNEIKDNFLSGLDNLDAKLEPGAVFIPIGIAAGISGLYILSTSGVSAFNLLGTTAGGISGAIYKSSIWALGIGAGVYAIAEMAGEETPGAWGAAAAGGTAAFLAASAAFAAKATISQAAAQAAAEVGLQVAAEALAAGTAASADVIAGEATISAVASGASQAQAIAAGNIVATKVGAMTAGEIAAAGSAEIAEIAAATRAVPPPPGPWSFWGPFLIAVAVAILIFVLTYRETFEKKVEFSCSPWQAPNGGSDCEKCNDELQPCSEYRCKSLGQSCDLINAGTTEERCVNINPGDVTSPTITPWEEILTEGYSYTDVKTRPPGIGMRIVRDSASDGCVKAFEPLKFGIRTNEPAQCKIDYNHTQKIDNMKYWFGESNLYIYEHQQQMALPGPEAINTQGIKLENDGQFTFYARCQDANGNVNTDEFAIRFCVEKGPDTTPPKIELTSIENNAPVAFNTTETDLDVYVNEPADCKWSKEDREYAEMENTMTCSSNVVNINAQALFKCQATLTGINSNKENKFYFRCKDQPQLETDSDRNVNKQSYVFTLKGSQALNIMNIEPNETISGVSEPVPVDLKVETANGAEDGKATCYYSTTGNENDYLQFFETGKTVHKQRQDLNAGSYIYYIKCIDLGGNIDTGTAEFDVEVDVGSPTVVRVYNEGGKLKIILNEDSTCAYSLVDCNFDIEDGTNMPYTNSTEHFADWQTDRNYYIRCEDEFGNKPAPTTCSIEVRAYDIEE